MKLYIIGNGFDLYHNLNTSYRSFGLFLKSKYPVIYDRLIEYYGFSDLNVIELHAGSEYQQTPPAGDRTTGEYESYYPFFNIC